MACLVKKMLDTFDWNNDFVMDVLLKHKIFINAASLLLSGDTEACKTFNSHALFVNDPTALPRLREICATPGRDLTPEQTFVITLFLWIHH